MNALLLLAAAAVTLFGDKPVTEKFAVPANLQTNAYVLSFEATFPKGAPRSLTLYQYLPSRLGQAAASEMHTFVCFDNFTRTLGDVVYGQFSGTPWFGKEFVEAPPADGETRRVEVICHDNNIAYWVQFGDKMYRTLVNRVHPHYRLQAVRFANFGSGAAAMKIANVQLRALEPTDLPKARDGFEIARAPKTFDVPVAKDGTETAHFQFIPGGYPVSVAMRFVDGTTNAPTIRLNSFAQRISLSVAAREKLDGQGLQLFQRAKTTGQVMWDDSGLSFAGCEKGSEHIAIYTRTKIGGRYRGDQIPAILTNRTDYGECASGHVFDFRLVRRGGVYQLWVDGDFGRIIPAKEISKIALDVPPDAQLKVLPVAKAVVSDPCFEPLPDRAPFAVAKCRENLGSHSLEHDGYRSRQPFERMPDCYLRRVPVGTYVKAKVRCRLAGDLKKNTRITARLTNFGINGDNNGASPDAMTQQTKTIARVPGKDVYDVEFDFDPGKIQDVIWQWGRESLHFEVLGGVIPVTFFAIAQDKPDAGSPSDVVVLGAELVRAPAGLFVENGSFGNLFYSETEVPHLTAHVTALLPGDYTVAWQVADVNGKVIETYTDKATLAASAKADLRRDFKVRTPGWYEVVTTLAAADGTPCVTRKSAFVVQAPDTRKAGYESPYFCWTPWRLQGYADAKAWKPWLEWYKRFGIHHATVGRYSEAFFGDYPMTVSPLPHLGVCTDPSKEKRLATYEAKIADFKKRFPHATMATVLHENYGGESPLEIVGGVSKIDETQKKNDELWTMRAREIASSYRKIWPGLKLSLGNSGASLGVAGELYRGKLEKNLIDYVGEESVGASTPPEITVAENFWTIREEARKFGYDHVQPCACYEWKSRPRRLYQSDRVLAAIGIRDVLVAHAWRSPTITIGPSEEPSTCYFTTSWGGGNYSRYPLFQPYPEAAAVSTLTRVLDCCTFKRMVPTGSKTVYCLEFTRGDEFVYALWTPRGAIDATVRTKARKAVRTTLYGTPADVSRWFSSEIACEISEEPCYLTLDKPVLSVTLPKGSRRPGLMKYAGMETACEFARFASADAVTPLTGKLVPPGFGPARGQLPILRDAKFRVSTADDEEKGKVVQIELLADDPIPSPLIKELATVALKEPVVIPLGAKTLALDVKGNSCWGKFFATIVDAKGKKFAFQGVGGECYFDQPGAVAINFDGWARLYMPLTADSPVKNASIHPNEHQWRCTNDGLGTRMTPPLKLTGFGATLKRKTLNLVEMEDVDTLAVRFAAAAAW